MLPAHLASFQYVLGPLVEVTDNEVHALGREADAALASLAIDPEKFSYEGMTLSYLTIAEGVVHTLGWRAVNHDELIAPVLDHILPLYRGNTPGSASIEAMTIARTWMRPSTDYHALVGGIINCLKKRMRCARTSAGRLVFYPSSSFESELRNRWFLERHNDARELAGRNILHDNSETRKTLRRIDDFIKSRDDDFYAGRCEAPDAAWYRDHCDAFADRALKAIFEIIDEDEVWSGMRKEEVVQAVRPLFVRAARRFLIHSRATARAKYEGGTSPVFLTCIETATRSELAQEVAASASISAAQAEAFIDSLIRKGRDERHGILPYPLLPLATDRVVVLPSAILFSAWPHARERVLAKSPKGNNSVSKARNRRHTGAVEEALRASGVTDVATEIVLYDKDGKQAITDLDVVAVDRQRRKVLVLQLKSFLTPANLLEVNRADEDVADAIRQCRLADNNRAETKRRIEERTGLVLDSGWQVFQVVVVEAVTGTAQPDPKYPTVSIEWALATIKKTADDLERFWHDALDLPDASAFRDRIRPAFELLDSHLRDLKLRERIAVFAYGS